MDVISSVDLEITPAFMNVENDTLYAGTFHLIPSYPAPDAHHLIAPSGNENAGVIFAYPADVNAPYGFATQAAYVYSIPDAVQGMAVLPDGNIMLSSSYGLTSSHLRTYDVYDAQQGAAFLVDGREVPLYFLDGNNLVAGLVAPPMSEGIESHDGRSGYRRNPQVTSTSLASSSAPAPCTRSRLNSPNARSRPRRRRSVPYPSA